MTFVFQVCAGSGGSVFKSLRPGTVDLVLTGELGHHDALELRQKNIHVLLTEHSNSERGFLPLVRTKMLAAADEFGLAGMEIEVTTQDEDPLYVV